MHKSQLFLYTLLAFVAGIAVQSYIALPVFVVYALAGAGGFLLVFWHIFYTNQSVLLLSLLCIAFAFGVFRYEQKEMSTESATLRAFNGAGEVSLRGVVADEPDIREKNTRYVISARSVETENGVYQVFGNALLFTNRYPAYEFGDLIVFTGTLRAPEMFDGFDYPEYLAKDGIYSQMFYPDSVFINAGQAGRLHAILFRIKRTFKDAVERALPEPHAAFLAGLVIGARSSIPEGILESFRITGVSHIIALSGFNITIIAESIRKTLRLFSISPSVTFWAASVFIALFTLMVGASPSIVRAALLGMLVLLARKEGRMYAPTNALVCVGALMILHNPKILRFDSAFQLSFLATAGLLYIAPRIETYVSRLPSAGGVRDNIITTLSAQALVLPLLLFQFGTISLISPVANILILSVIPVTMLFGFILWITSFISTAASLAPAGAAYLLLAYQLFVVEVLRQAPFAMVYIGAFSGVLVVLLYSGIAYWLLKR
jgi:competence protein ComEC